MVAFPRRRAGVLSRAEGVVVRARGLASGRSCLDDIVKQVCGLGEDFKCGRVQVAGVMTRARRDP